MTKNTQQKLSLVRKPRVHITYDLQIGDASEKRELPFVVGVLADLFGHNKENTPYKERKFTKIEKGNFDSFLESLSPSLDFAVKDTSSSDENARTKVELKFKSMQDFNPDNFIKQSETMGPLLRKRKLLVDLLSKIDGNDALVELLIESLKDSGKAKELSELA
jgi:type VI secretion system protein ImpB